MGKIKRLDVTANALELIQTLENRFGDLMFYLSGGCCEGTQPQCFEKGTLFTRSGDVCIGQINGFDFWVDKDLFEYWKHAHFTLDVMNGIGAGGFSLETPFNKTFILKYRIFNDDELNDLEPVRFSSYD
ncbi:MULTISPECIES: DUF779 domain-containing protein [Flavobacterium]|uniref:DUF779 domain-containing protein n=1 Tax=Flavobacterium jumunjinense TaxID=998845 RepID=A0ABV5GMA3_9FLAO|nr:MULTISPECIES: DUF779 domain-containing protein [Flavobacterium]